MTSYAAERETNSPRIAIVGGGVSGLAAAYELHRANQRSPASPVAFDLFDAGDSFGGILQTDAEQGFLVERSADMFSVKEPWARELCEALGLSPELVATNERFRRAFVVRAGRLYPVPEGFTLMAPSKWWPIAKSPLLSVAGKLRLAGERLVRRRESTDDESLASFSRRRFGDEAYRRLIQPLIGGIYTADPERLSMQATLPQFVEMERKHGSVVAASMRRDREGSNSKDAGARYGGFVAPRLGMAQLVAALVAALPSQSLHPRSSVRSILRASDGRWSLAPEDGRTLDYDAVLIAVRAYAGANLLSEAAPELSSSLGEIPYASAAIVVGGYRKDRIGRPLEGFGLVVPAAEGRKILASSFGSVKFPGRAPDDAVLIRTFVGGALQAELLQQDDAALTAIVREELGELLGIQGEAIFSHVVRWNRAMPQYHVGHLDLVARIERQVAALPGLALAGAPYRGVGIPHCIRSGSDAAKRLREQAAAARSSSA